jgi:hypothetical protein
VQFIKLEVISLSLSLLVLFIFFLSSVLLLSLSFLFLYLSFANTFVSLALSSAARQDHVRNCPMVPVVCEKCNEKVSRQNLEEHLSQLCLEQEITCQFAEQGCNAKARLPLGRFFPDISLRSVPTNVDPLSRSSNGCIDAAEGVRGALEPRCGETRVLAQVRSRLADRRTAPRARDIPEGNYITFLAKLCLACCLAYISQAQEERIKQLEKYVAETRNSLSLSLSVSFASLMRCVCLCVCVCTCV